MNNTKANYYERKLSKSQFNLFPNLMKWLMNRLQKFSRRIKLMQSGYTLPDSTGSLLKGKFTHTSCEYSNRKF